MLKLGQIGVGYWGPNILRNIVNNKNCIVKSVSDLSDFRRKFVKDNYKDIKIVTSDALDIIKDSEIDAVIIATPAHTHYSLTKACLEAGKHILVEKPMATKLKEVEHIGELAKENNLVAMVGHTFLYNSAVRKIKEIIDSGELGKIRYIYTKRASLGRIRSDVDALWNLAPHDISIVQYWLDDMSPIKKKKNGMSYIQKGIDDVVFLNIIYPQSILVNIHVSWLDPVKVRKITIVGSKKMIVYDDIADNKISIYDKGIEVKAVLGENMDFDNPEVTEFKYREGDSSFVKFEWDEPLKKEIEHFVECITIGTKCITGANHAAKVVEILESC